MCSAHRLRMIAAAIDAIDGRFGDLSNDKAYLRQATYVASLLAVGKWRIHPNQLPFSSKSGLVRTSVERRQRGAWRSRWHSQTSRSSAPPAPAWTRTGPRQTLPS